MKKRVKLLTTIASLCLAVALMAFGVYAATTASFGVKSSVSFTVGDNLAGSVTVTQYVGNSETQNTKAQEGSLSFSSTDTIVKASETIDLTAEDTPADISPENNYVKYVIAYTPVTGTVDASITASGFKCNTGSFDTTAITAGAAGWQVISNTQAEKNTLTIVLKYTGTAAAENMVITFDVDMAKYNA